MKDDQLSRIEDQRIEDQRRQRQQREFLPRPRFNPSLQFATDAFVIKSSGDLSDPNFVGFCDVSAVEKMFHTSL